MAEASQKIILFELCKNGFIRQTRRKSSVVTFKVCGGGRLAVWRGGLVVSLWWCGGVFVVVWLCFCGGLVVFLWLCFCGGLVVFLRLCFDGGWVGWVVGGWVGGWVVVGHGGWWVVGWVGGPSFFISNVTSVVHSHPPSHYICTHAFLPTT